MLKNGIVHSACGRKMHDWILRDDPDDELLSGCRSVGPGTGTGLAPDRAATVGSGGRHLGRGASLPCVLVDREADQPGWDSAHQGSELSDRRPEQRASDMAPGGDRRCQSDAALGRGLLRGGWSRATERARGCSEPSARLELGADLLPGHAGEGGMRCRDLR